MLTRPATRLGASLRSLRDRGFFMGSGSGGIAVLNHRLISATPPGSTLRLRSLAGPSFGVGEAGGFSQAAYAQNRAPGGQAPGRSQSLFSEAVRFGASTTRHDFIRSKLT